MSARSRDRRACLLRLTARADEIVLVANVGSGREVERALAEWTDQVGADRIRQVHEIFLDRREINDPWR